MRYIAIAALAMALASSALAAPIQWTVATGGNDHFYDAVAFTDGLMSWEQARLAAAQMQWLGATGHLATFNTSEENAWVWVSLANPDSFFLGGRQTDGSVEPGGGWHWITGEPWVYTNWNVSEPNNVASGPTGVENCLQFVGGSNPPGMWNDADEAPGARGYVVEFEPAPVPNEYTTWGALKALYRIR